MAQFAQPSASSRDVKVSWLARRVRVVGRRVFWVVLSYWVNNLVMSAVVQLIYVFFNENILLCDIYFLRSCSNSRLLLCCFVFTLLRDCATPTGYGYNADWRARIPFGHSREDWLPSVNLLCHLLLIQWNTSFQLLYPSPAFISFCVIPALFSSIAIPSICKILKLCPFGIHPLYFAHFICCHVLY